MDGQTFTSGDVLHGRVYFNFYQPETVSSIQIKLEGMYKSVCVQINHILICYYRHVPVQGTNSDGKLSQTK